jgi:hypothetical protein
MPITTLKSVCNLDIDLKYEIEPDAPFTFILSSGYSIDGFEEPIQVALVELLREHNCNWIQYVFPERNPKTQIDDLYISSGLFTLSEVYKWAKGMVENKIGLFGISFGGNISLELALREPVESVILVNSVFDYVDFRRKQLGEKAMLSWHNTLIARLHYPERTFALGYRFIQEAEQQNLAERALQIECPVHAFQGLQDPFINSEQLLAIQAQRSSWRAYLVRGADHSFDQRVAIDAFLSEIEPVIKSISAE